VWYFNPRRYVRRSLKWQHCYTGPFLVVRVQPPVNYVLQKSARSQPFVVHCDKIKKYSSATPINWLTGDADVSAEVPGGGLPTDQVESPARVRQQQRVSSGVPGARRT